MRRLICAILAAGSVALLAGCGSSSKPAYCSDRANLESSVKALPGMVASANVSGLQSQVSKIQSEAKTATSSAKSDFPSETSTLTQDVDAVVTSVKALPANPSVQDLAKIGVQAASAVSAVSSFVSATKSKCS